MRVQGVSLELELQVDRMLQYVGSRILCYCSCNTMRRERSSMEASSDPAHASETSIAAGRRTARRGALNLLCNSGSPSRIRSRGVIALAMTSALAVVCCCLVAPSAALQQLHRGCTAAAARPALHLSRCRPGPRACDKPEEPQPPDSEPLVRTKFGGWNFQLPRPSKGRLTYLAAVWLGIPLLLLIPGLGDILASPLATNVPVLDDSGVEYATKVQPSAGLALIAVWALLSGTVRPGLERKARERRAQERAELERGAAEDDEQDRQ